MTDPMIQMQMDDHIRAALREDMPFGDVSTAAVMPEPRPGRVQLIAKADGVIAGLAVFSRVFALRASLRFSTLPRASSPTWRMAIALPQASTWQPSRETCACCWRGSAPPSTTCSA